MESFKRIQMYLVIFDMKNKTHSRVIKASINKKIKPWVFINYAM